MFYITYLSIMYVTESPQKPVSTLASAITDTAPSKQAVQAWDPIAEMWQQLTKGLTGLNDDPSAAAAANQSGGVSSTHTAAPSSATVTGQYRNS